MSVIKPKGLKGLRGINELSSEDRGAWIANNSHRLPDRNTTDAFKFDRIVDRLYRNDLFRNRFKDEDLFLSMTPGQRDEYYRADVIGENIQIYKNDPLFSQISKMTLDGQLSILESGFETEEEIKKRAEGVGTAQAAASRPMIAHSTGIVSGATPLNSQEIREAYLEGALGARENKFKVLLAEDNERKKVQSEPLSREYLNYWQTSINKGTLKVEDIDNEFDRLIGSNSNYYKAFKDTDVFEHFTSTDKMRFLANFMGVAQNFDGESAVSVMETDMQNYVSDNQNGGDWAGNTVKSIVLKGVANLANKAMGIEALTRLDDPESLNNFLQGKDKNGKDLPWYNNPLYWQGVDQFNTFDSNAINKARLNGGISPDQNITRAGEEMDFFSWKTLNDAGGQLGYFWSEYLASKALGGVGKGLGKMVPGLKTSKLARGVGTFLDVGQSVVGQAEAEGLSSYQEALQQANEVIDAQIDAEVETQVRAYAKTGDFTSLVQSKINDIKAESKDSQITWTEEGLKAEATNRALQELSDRFKVECQARHAGDREQAERAATSAYMTTASVFAVKEAATNSMLQRFLFNKGTRRALGDNGPRVDVVNNADGTVSASISNWNKYGKPVIKNAATEFFEEWSDTYVNNLGQGLALNEYLSYHNKKYNPKAYSAATDNILANFIMGFKKAGESVFTKDAFYEGWLGAISGVGGAPLEIYQGRQKGKALGKEVEVINNVLKKHGSALQDIAATMSTLHEADEAVAKNNTLQAIDAKQRQAFDLVHALTELGNSEVGSQSNAYTTAMQTIQSLADGSIEDAKLNDLVTQFLGQPKNRTIAGLSDAKSRAVSLLQENAQSILDTQATINEVYTTLDNLTNGGTLPSEVRQELAYLKVMGKNWQDRLNSIKESLGGGKGSFNINAEYGSKKGYERKEKALSESISTMKSDLEKLQKKLSDKDYKNSSEKKALELKKKALKSAIKKVEIEHKALKSHANLFENSDYAKTLSEAEILALPVEQMAQMLSPNNIKNYSEEQQQIINSLKQKLTTKNPALLQQVQDAAILSNRISEVDTAFSRIVDNPVEAVLYLQELKKQRFNKLVNLYQQQHKAEVEELFHEKSDEEAKAIARDLPYYDVEEYIKDHPEKEGLLKGIAEVSKLEDDSRLVIDRILKDSDSTTINSIYQSIHNIISDSANREEAINAIEDAIVSDSVDAQTRQILDNVLNELQELDYQRNSTKVSNREAAKKKQQADRKKAAEEAVTKQKEAEEIAKKEAESKKKEVPESGSNTTPEVEASTEVSPDGSNVQETISVDETRIGSGEQLTGAEDVDLTEKVESPTPEEQAKGRDEVKEVPTTPAVSERTTSNSSDSTTLLGNVMYRYDGNSLKEDGYQVKRVGKKDGDSMNKFFAWMESAGIDYQEIIDNELHSILAANSKIQFLLVNPQDNATNDSDMGDHVLEVVEYTDKVANVHKESRGGVITANGKRWLVIGTLGFSNNEQGDAYRTIKKELKRKRYKYFTDNSSERFYVNPDYSTQAAKVDAGWVTRKLEGDSEVKIRSIRELLDDEARNPRGLSLEDLKWGIQFGTGFLTVGVSSRNKIHSPKDSSGNSGNVFLLVEAANGEYIPIAIKPVMYSELKDSTLKTEIDNLLNELTSTNHSERLTAIKSLVQLLVLNDNNNILIGTKDKNTLSILSNGIVTKTFNLDDPAFNKMEFLESVTSLNPRVNVTLTALSTPTTLEMLDEAGVLLTDVAKLGTSNAGFSVYNMDSDGNPIINTPVENTIPGESDLKRGESVIVLGQVYRKKRGDWVDATDKVVTDPRLQDHIKYNNIIQTSNLSPVVTKDDYEYYIVNQDADKPTAIKRHSRTHAITVATREQSLKLLKQMREKDAERRAAKALEESSLDENSLEEVPLEEEVMTQEEIYKQILGEPSEVEEVSLDDDVSESNTPTVKEDINTTGSKSLAELQAEKNINTLSDVLGHSIYGSKLDSIIDAKIESGAWTGVPDNIELLEEYLNGKNISTSGITNVDSWLDMIEGCK